MIVVRPSMIRMSLAKSRPVDVDPLTTQRLSGSGLMDLISTFLAKNLWDASKILNPKT